MKNADIVTAIVTPFTPENEIDFSALEKLTNHLIATGSTGFVIGGTTGETPTLTRDEQLELYRKFVQIVAGRAVIIAGTGSNNTAATIALTNEVSQIQGIDYALVVVPYYSKTSQRGLLAHFSAVAANSKVPILIYNIPGRTGIVMENETIVELAHNKNIAGIKQCTSLNDISFIVEHTSDFLVYTGEDPQALSAKELGATGVISVASHLYGAEMREMYTLVDQGNVLDAASIMRKLQPKMLALFSYPSPTPVKAALAYQGYLYNSCRLPLVPLTSAEEDAVLAALELVGGHA